MGRPRVTAIIQARMGSTRFPGKVLKDLVGKPVLWHIIYRLRKCESLDEIVIATSVNPADDPLVEFAAGLNVPVIRGSEDNVLERYRKAAEESRADIIVRVTGDAPLVDPKIIDRLVEHLISENADYCTGDPDTPSIHEGFSPFTREALEKLVREAAGSPVAMEHVTAYFKEHPDRFHIVIVPMPEEHNFTRARISVDTPEDLKFLEEVYRKLDVTAGDADLADVVRLIKSEPGLLEINSGVRQKKATEKTKRALIRCDGDEMIGLGHLVRCIALAEELRNAHSWGITFAVKDGRTGFQMAAQEGFDVEIKPVACGEVEWLDNLMEFLDPNAFIMDIPTDLNVEKVAEWRRNGILIVDIDDPHDRRLEANLVFYPPVPKVGEMSWTGFEGELFVGWEWVILRKQFAASPVRQRKKIGEPPTILVTMGGSDPHGLTLKTIEALEGLREAFRTIVVTGRGFSERKELARIQNRSSRFFEIREDVRDMASLMSQADIAVASFGVTAYELAAVGLPAIFLCLNEDHFRHAQLFVDMGVALNLGIHNTVEVSMIRKEIGNLLSHRDRLNTMACRTKGIVDGQGAKRIAKLITTRSAVKDV